MPEQFNLKDEVPQKKSDWEISDLYQRTWRIIKQNKVLWIFGAALGGLSSSGNFNSSSDFNSEDFRKLFNQTPQQQEQVNQVLGASTNYFYQHIQDIFTQIPLYLYLLIGIEVFLGILFTVILLVVYKSWADASLLSATNQAGEDQKPTIASASEPAFKALKSFVWLDIVPSLVIFVVFVLSMALITSGLVFGNLPIKILSGIGIVVMIILSVYALIYLTLTLTWAKRQVIDEGKSAKLALSDGYKVAKKKYWASILLGLVNNIAAGIAFFVPIIVFILLFAGGVLLATASKNPTLNILLITLGGIAMLALIIIITVLTGVTTAFKATVWTLAYKKIKGKYDSD